MLHQSINTLFDEAFRTLSGHTDAVERLFNDYSEVMGIGADHSEYLEFLLDRYQDVGHRPSAAILLFYYYDLIEDVEKTSQLFDELTKYQDNQDVVYFLFKEYGRNLHDANNRISFFDIVSKNSFLETMSPLRFYYFKAVSEFYNLRWFDGWEALQEIKHEKYINLNPDFFLYWNDADGCQQIFEGEIIKDRKIKKIRIIKPFFKNFYLVTGDYKNYPISTQVQVKLKFFLDGVKAEICDF